MCLTFARTRIDHFKVGLKAFKASEITDRKKKLSSTNIARSRVENYCLHIQEPQYFNNIMSNTHPYIHLRTCIVCVYSANDNYY